MADELVLPNGDPARGNGASEKEVSPQVLDRSVVDVPDAPAAVIPSIQANLLFLAGQYADEVDPWGRTVNTKTRDRQLREFLMTESVFASALGVVCSRNAGFSWKLEGPPRTVARSQELLESANLGEGWEDFIIKISIDLYTQDAGAFIEIVRATDAPDSPVIGLNHLDAMRCYHTGAPEAPVIYQDRKGKYHLLKGHQVITLAEMPTPIEGLYGLQYCALTRMLLAAQLLKNIAVYKYEKTGGRHNRAIHLVAGMSTKQINDALAQHRIWADAAGLQRYQNPLIIASADPNIRLDLKTLELASLPDNFDEETSFKHYINQIAMAFNGDYQDFAPLPGGNLGTSAQSQVLHMKTRGKGPALFRGIISKAMNFRVLPSLVTFRFEEQDIEAEQIEAEIKERRAKTRQVQVDTGEISAEEARQMAADEGDIPQEFLEEDLTPKVTAEDEARIEATQPRGQGSPPAPAEEAGTREFSCPSCGGITEGEAYRQRGRVVARRCASCGFPQLDAAVPIPELEEDKAARAGPFDRERLRAEGRFRRSVLKGLQAIQRNVNRRLRQESRKELTFKALQDIPNDEQFWVTQREEMAKAIGNQLQELLLQGVDQAAKLGLAIDFELVNQQVLDLSARFMNEWWNGLQRRTRNSMQTAIQAHIQAGDPLPALTKKLEPLFGPVRAEVISSTEVTRLYAEGNKAAYKSAGIEIVEFQTVKDAAVDPDCEVLQGERWPVDQVENTPPIHPRCRCWLAPVVDEKPLRADVSAPGPEYVSELEQFPSVDSFGQAKKITADMQAKYGSDPQFGILHRAILERTGTDRPIYNALNREIEAIVGGGTSSSAEARELLTAIRASRVDRVLYRGAPLQGTPEELVARYAKGSAVDLPIASTSSSRAKAIELLEGKGVPVLFEFQNVSGLPISALSPETWSLSEVLISGKYRVISSRIEEGVVHVVLRGA
jgi:SPP1 gp7 family putative phage head morphogenesis protein